MGEDRETWVRTTTGWLMRENGGGPLEGHHGPNAQHFSTEQEIGYTISLAGGLVLALFYLANKGIESGAAMRDPLAMIGTACAILAGAAICIVTIYKIPGTRGAIVIDPVAGYVDMPAGLLDSAHRAAPSVTSPAPGRARIAFAEIAQAERRQLGTRRGVRHYIYIADRYGEVHLYIDRNQLDAALALLLWRSARSTA